MQCYHEENLAGNDFKIICPFLLIQFFNQHYFIMRLGLTKYASDIPQISFTRAFQMFLVFVFLWPPPKICFFSEGPIFFRVPLHIKCHGLLITPSTNYGAKFTGNCCYGNFLYFSVPRWRSS